MEKTSEEYMRVLGSEVLWERGARGITNIKNLKSLGRGAARNIERGNNYNMASLLKFFRKEDDLPPLVSVLRRTELRLGWWNAH